MKQYTYEEVEASVGKYCYYYIGTSSYIDNSYWLEECGLRKIYKVNPPDHTYPIVIEEGSVRGDINPSEILHIFNEDNKLVKLLVKETRWVSTP